MKTNHQSHDRTPSQNLPTEPRRAPSNAAADRRRPKPSFPGPSGAFATIGVALLLCTALGGIVPARVSAGIADPCEPPTIGAGRTCVDPCNIVPGTTTQLDVCVPDPATCPDGQVGLPPRCVDPCTIVTGSGTSTEASLCGPGLTLCPAGEIGFEPNCTDPLLFACSILESETCPPTVPDPAQCIPPIVMSSPALVSSMPQTEPMAQLVSAAESLRLMVAMGLLDGTLTHNLEDTIGVPSPVNGSVLVDRWSTLRKANDATQLVQDFSTGSSTGTISVPDLVALALTAVPDGPKTPFHEAGYGRQWLQLIRDRYELLNTELNETYTHAEKRSNGYPVDAVLIETMQKRFERFLLGVAYLQYALYEANTLGILADAIPGLLRLAVVAANDLGIVYFGLTLSGTSLCSNLQLIFNTLQGLVKKLSSLINFLIFVSFSEVAFVAAVMQGVWVDAYAVMEGPVLSALSTAGTTSEGQTQQLMHDEHPAQGIYHGSLLGAFGLVGTVTRTLPQGGAKTDTVGSGKWSADAMGVVGSMLADYDWHVTLPNEQTIGMRGGVLAGLEESPAFFEEGGTIWQNTSYDYMLLTQASQYPRTIVNPPEWQWWQCAGYSLGVASAFMMAAYETAGAAAAAGTASGPAAPAVATGVAVAGAFAMAAGFETGIDYGKDKCKSKEVYDEGYYIEAGVYTNYWSDVAWFGSGLTLAGGLVQIYGTATGSPVAPYREAIPYDNQEDTKGYYHGVEMARQKRENAQAQAEANLPQFRSIAGALGDAYITIEILCAAVGDLITANPDGTGTTPLRGDSGLCIRAVLGALSVVNVQGEGYGAITIQTDAAGDGGYVNVNGQQAATPGLVELEGAGGNVHGD